MITRTIPNHKYVIQAFDKDKEELVTLSIETTTKKFRTDSAEINWLKKKCEEGGNVFLKLVDHVISFEKYSMDEETFIIHANKMEVE